MIAHLAGSVAAVAPDGAVIEVGGVGLLVQCTPGTLAGLRVGEQARVATSLVVREDSLTLYGFASEDERNTFELLQTASGVGPRLAQAMLGRAEPRRAAARGRGRGPGDADLGARHRAQGRAADRAGAGLASARRRTSACPAVAGRAAAGAPQWQDQVRAGLVSLGWQAREADQAIAAVEPDLMPGDAEPARSTSSVALRAALRVLGRP